MSIPEFRLEEFWKKYEFTAPYLLCCSDAETWALQELLAMADEESTALWNSLSFSYTTSPGNPVLRQEIASLYETVVAEEVVTFAGTQEGIYCAMRVLIEPGDHVIVIDPCYQSLSTLPEAFGAEVTAVPLKYEEQWKLNLDELKKAFRSNTKLLVLNYPHNPTGAILDAEVLREIVELARKNGTYIFCDEVYRYMEVDESHRVPSIADVYEKGISLNALTKAFGLAGLRIGWLATRDAYFLQKVSAYKLYTSISNSAASEVLAIIALRAKEKVLKRNRGIMLDNLQILDAFMKRNQKHLAWVYPQCGTIAVVKLLLPMSVEAFAEDLVRSEGILIMPGSIFEMSGNFFRIGYGKKNLASILERFESYLKRQG